MGCAQKGAGYRPYRAIEQGAEHSIGIDNIKALVKQVFEIEEFMSIGWVHITHHGEENTYFDYMGPNNTPMKGYCKLYL